MYVRNYSYGSQWVPAVVERCTGPLSYTVLTGTGQTWRRHVDQLRKKHTLTAPESIIAQDSPVMEKELSSL